MKPLSQYNSAIHNRDGLKTHCKTCQSERSKRWYRENPQGSSRLRMAPGDKTQVTEAVIAKSFSDEHVRATHRIAFMPEFAGEEDLRLWSEVIASMVFGRERI
jgi:hypothetical protein